MQYLNVVGRRVYTSKQNLKLTNFNYCKLPGNSTYSFCSFIDVSITPKSCLELFLENVQVPVFERLLGNNIFLVTSSALNMWIW
jgi:uncharacterized protein YunC (DUF1805 family)